MCLSAGSASASLLLFFAELRVQRNPDGPRLAVVTREDSCFCVYRFELLQLQSSTNGLLKPDGTSGLNERWSGTALVLVPLRQVLTPGARGKPLMTARWLAAGRELWSASPVQLYLPFFPSASLSVRNMFPVVSWEL